MEVTGDVLKPDANTNLMVSRTLIPTITVAVVPEKKGGDLSVKLVTAVFAVGAGKLDAGEIRRRWEDLPIIQTRGEVGEAGDCIVL